MADGDDSIPLADGDGPARPKAPVPAPGPPKPLPRLWKTEEEAEPEESPKPDRRSKREVERQEREHSEAEARSGKPKSRPQSAAGPNPSKPKPKSRNKSKSSPSEPERKGVLIEETPEYDTYDARQRVRLLIGGVIGVAVIGGLVVLVQSLRGPAEDLTDLPDEGAAPTTSAPAPAATASADLEAKNLLGTARQLAKNGKSDEAVTVLKRVVSAYPATGSAVLAKQALARPATNLPLFIDEPAVVASTTATAKADPDPEVRAVEPASTPVRPGGDAEAQLRLPANPAETARPAGSLPSTTAVAPRPLPAGFRAVPETGVHATGWPLQVVSDRDGATMCLVPAGVHTLGRDDGPADEGPEHRVKLGAYYVDQHEVTIRQFAFFVKETGRKPAPARPIASKDAPPPPADDHPAVNVSANEASAYCEWAGKALPTEAQWEAAARATDGRVYPWGSSPPTWSRPRASRQIDPVMSFDLDQSPYATFDQAGNAWEWTRDWFDAKYYQTIKASVAENPTGPTGSRARPPMLVVKGGSKTWGVAWREGYKVETRLPYLGFRCVLAVDAPSDSPAATATPANPATPPTNARGIVPF